MVMKCAYFMCQNQNKSSGRSFFSFPTSNPNRLKKWINNCGDMAIAHLSTKALRHRCICSDHFQKRHILNLNGSRKRLSNMAVPVHFKGDDATETAPHSPFASTSGDELDLVDEPFMEEEDDGEYFIKQEPIKPALYGLQMVPVVYTTRLDDMVVLNSIGLNHHPRELTAKILEESKPVLYSYPDYYSGQINETSFRLLKAKLRKLYDPQMIKIKEEPDINLVTEESRGFNDTSKYSNLLKLCKPLSIVLTKLELQTVSAGTYDVEEMEYLQEEGTRSPAPTHFNVSGSRLLTNGVMEIYDLYSNEYTIYCTDHKGNLIDCLIDSPDNAFKYHSIRDSAEMELQFKYCCWAKRNKHMQSLYPKVLLYTNFRFMMKPHLCSIDECICCCRKKDNFAKPSTAFTDDGSSVKKSAYLQEDIEIQELEDEIQQKLLQINKAPRLNTNDWIQALLTKATNDPPQVNSQNQSSLIEKALSYKPIPKKQTENRRLLTLKQKKTQYGVIIFRNFALDERDVYEINSNGEVQFYTKLICFNNTNRPDVKKLLQKPKAVYDVCCWFKRESITSKLFEDQYLHPSAVKFMRNRHACLSDKCSCCCKPNVGIGEATLTDVPFSPQYSYTPLKKITKPLNVNNAKGNKPKSNSRTIITKETNKHPNILRKTLMSQSTNTTHKQRQGSLVAAETTTHDDDCEIVEDMQYRPLQPKPLPTDQVKVATVVNVPNISSSELSEEVNNTVASILERFKDVRLTINSNGKVAAALNMPINTLSTVELKVLASILSYAQSQVNLLGLKSEMSLSSFISRSATDNEPDPAKKVEPIKITQKLPPDGNRNCTTTTNLSSTNVVGISSIYETPNSNDTDIKCETEVSPNELEESATEVQLQLTKLATDFDAIIPPVHKENVFNSFTNSTSATKQNFNDSFASFIATQYDGPKNSFAPVITSVFSMKDQETAASGTLSGESEAMLTKQPADQLSDAKTFGQSTKKFANLSKKRKQDFNSKTQASKRLRVLSPSQIGSLTSHSISDPAEIYNTFCKPVQNSETMEVCGFTPGVPLLANTSFQLVTVGDANAQQTKLIQVPNLKPTASDVSGSSKTLVVCPLNMDSNNDDVPVSVSSFSSVAIPTEEFDAPTIKDEPTDDCILGM